MTSSEVYKRRKHAFILAVIVIGLINDVRCVTYKLSAVPEKVALGQTLTITAELSAPFIHGTNTDLKIMLTQPGEQTITIFQYRAATGCIFLMQPYISTGTVVACAPANSRYVIRFQPVTADHVGLYELSAPLENPARSANQGTGVNAIVQLLVAPTSVTVAPSRREVVEGQATNFVCTVDDQATLPVSFVWKRIVNGNRVNPSVASTIIPGGRSNKLSWNSVSRQHAGQYDCRASNEVGQLTSQPATLVVYYPATSVTLSISTGTTTVSVTTSVTFTCTSTGGNPRPGLVIADATSGRVLKESVQPGSATLTYGPVTMQKSANGAKYQCKTKATVSAGTVPSRDSNTLTMNVQFPPDEIKAPASVTVDEGQSTSVRCETTTTSNPETELTWTGPTAVDQTMTSESLGAHGGMTTGRFLTLTGDRTRNGATYICTATHLGQQIYTKSTKLEVNFAPNAIAFYDTLDTPVQENQERVLRCRAETSKPAGTIVWRKILSGIQSIIAADPPTEVPGEFGGTVLETSSTIQPSKRDNEAKYWCEVEYTYTNGTKVTRRANAKVLEVYYPVDVGITVSQKTDNIREGDPLTLTCTTSGGNPQTIDKYSWSHNGNILFDESERQLSLNPIKYDQGGKYECNVTTKGGTSTTSIDIDVKYKPREDPDQPHYNEIGASVGETVTFSLAVLANPLPTKVEWTNGTGAALGPRFKVSMKNASEPEKQVYSLEVNDITQNDFASYLCKVINLIDSATFIVRLRAEANPETPIDFKIASRSSSALTLQWKSQFSGATSQTFELQQFDSVSDNYRLIKEVADTTFGSTIEVVVESLNDGTEYRFRLRSRNDLEDKNLKYSEFTPPLRGRTKVIIPASMKFAIKPGDVEGEVTVSWPTTVEGIDLLDDYKDAVVVVTYTPVRSRKRRSAPETGPNTNENDENRSRTVKASFSEGQMTLNLTKPEYYNYDIELRDVGKTIVFSRKDLKVTESNGGGSPDITGAVAGGLVVGFIIILVLGIVLVVMLYRKGIVGGNAKKEAPPPTDQVEGTTNPGYLGSIDSGVPQVHVSTPAISPYVVLPTEMRPKRTSMVDKVKQRLSTVSNKSDEKASHYAEARVGLSAESPYAEASFSEKPAPSNGAPPAKGRRGFNFFKGKGKKEQGSPASNKAFADINGGTPGESSTDEISPYGTTNAYHDDISPYGTTNARVDDISPYGTTNAPAEEISPYGTTNLFRPKAGPSAGAPLYAEVNKKGPAAPQPLYAEVDKTKKNNPMPVYAQVNKNRSGPPEPLYAEVDKGKKAPPAPPMYAAVDRSKKGRPVPQDDAVMYAEINQDLINGRPDPVNDTYANLGSMPGRGPEPTYANLSDLPPPRPEQPTTHVGVDGIIYTELIKKPEPPGKPVPKPKPKPKPEETIYAEIDPTKSKPQ